MNNRSLVGIFTTLRILQLLLVLITIFLEVIEYSSFNEFYSKEGFPHSAYFNGKITKSTIDENKVYYNGVKVISYIVLLITLTDGGIYIRNCSYTGPAKRDIFISVFFKTLWLIYSVASSYPGFLGYKFNCATSDSTTAVKRECSTKAAIISIGWINTILFSTTALIALVLWKSRQEACRDEKRMRALGDVVYKYQPRPDTIVRINEPEQVMIFDRDDKDEKNKTKRYASYFPRTSTSQPERSEEPFEDSRYF